MQDIGHIFYNQILLTALGACFLAQGLKAVGELLKNRKLTVQTFVQTGGMPSAHSAFVTALATAVGQAEGWESAQFAIASVLAFLVMYDAAGVRQAAGKQARILNQILDELFQENHNLNEERLKELLGHTPVQVVAGSALGIAVAWLADLAGT